MPMQAHSKFPGHMSALAWIAPKMAPFFEIFRKLGQVERRCFLLPGGSRCPRLKIDLTKLGSWLFSMPWRYRFKRSRISFIFSRSFFCCAFVPPVVFSASTSDCSSAIRRFAHPGF